MAGRTFTSNDFYRKIRGKQDYPQNGADFADFIDFELAEKRPHWGIFEEMTDQNTPRDAYECVLMEDFILNLLETLTDREQKVIYCRFWLNFTLKQTGDLFEVSRERIRSIEAKGLRKLRHPSRKDTIPDQDIWSWVSLKEKEKRRKKKELEDVEWGIRDQEYKKQEVIRKEENRIFAHEQEERRRLKRLTYYRKLKENDFFPLEDEVIKEATACVAVEKRGSYWNPYNL